MSNSSRPIRSKRREKDADASPDADTDETPESPVDSVMDEECDIASS